MGEIGNELVEESNAIFATALIFGGIIKGCERHAAFDLYYLLHSKN